MAMDLLQKPLDDLSKDQRRELDGVARRIHKDGLAAFADPPDESPPPPADIGMSSTRAMEGWFRERRRAEPPKPRQLTCDEVVARQNAREAAAKEKRKERDERLKDAREIAQIFAEADRGRQDRSSREQEMLRGVDPSFIDYCRRRGMYDPREIYERWQREYAMPSYMIDPTKGPSRW